MTDAATTGFRPGLSPAELATFKWLVLGHIVFAVALFVVLSGDLDMGNVWITPLFALPLVLLGPKDRIWIRALVLLVGFTGIHYLATILAIDSYEPAIAIAARRAGTSPLVPGLVGGAVGAAGSFALCALFRLTGRDKATLMTGLVGIVLLAAVGSLGVYGFLRGFGSVAGPIGPFLVLYTPWQLVFAYVLAKLLR